MVENRTGPQTIEFLTKRVMALGAVQTGQFLVDCDTYMSVPAVGKSFFHSFVVVTRETIPYP
jgi:mediator of RNA polymerase II transcription subunit 20